MAMMRCATHASDGKANLHQGAVGVGLDIGTGQSLHAVQYNRIINQHPDSGIGFADLAIPHWQQVLDLAASCAGMTGLDYNVLFHCLDRRQLPNERYEQLFDDIRVMEIEVLNTIHAPQP